MYTTKQGDTWDIIAKKMYGNEAYVSFLMENNKKALDYFIFPEGIRLNIPDAPEKKSSLPKWRL